MLSNSMQFGSVKAALVAFVLVILVSGTAQAATAYTGSANMSVTQIAGVVTTSFGTLTNSSHSTMCGPNNDQPQWMNGDTFTFTDSWTADNSGDAVNFLTASFHLELYEWVHGVPGNKLSDPGVASVTIAPTHTSTGTLIVSGTYTGWNGNPGCELSFHVYRHAGSPNPNNPNSTWF